MIIQSDQATGDCDACANGNASHGALSRGATGRWCEVMWLCRSCAINWAGGEENIMSAAEARVCDKVHEGYDYPDF